MDITEKSRKYKGKSESGEKDSEQTTYIIYAICHVAGMLSACANPIIYGFLNENFKAEFQSSPSHVSERSYLNLALLSSYSHKVIVT